MDLFQIEEITEAFNHAGTKATADVSKIGKEMGFKSIPIKMNTIKDTKFAKIQRQVGYFYDWKNAYNQITDRAIVLLQHPFHHRQLTRERILMKLKQNKKVQFISLVHDIEQLRGFRNNAYYDREFSTMLQLADVIIVHNSQMLKWFNAKGIDNDKLVNLHIFDYLQDRDNREESIFDKSITIAGNLDTTKCEYISQLGLLESIEVNLFGPNFDEKLRKQKNIKYKGSFPVDEIPMYLKKGFGLIWDGNSIDGCKGLAGQYLKYNNPHKLSLYLASGMPVLIWKGAAEAEFVTEHGVGICINNLKELDSIMQKLTVNDYNKLRDNVVHVRKKLINGEYAKTALAIAVERITRGKG